MQKDEGDQPAQQPQRSCTEEEDRIKKQRSDDHAIPIHPAGTTIRGNQQYLTKGQDRHQETDDDEYTIMGLDNAEGCAPSRKDIATNESAKILTRTFLLSDDDPHSAGGDRNRRQSDRYHTSSVEANTTTTGTSRPGVVAVPGNAAAQQTSNRPSSNSNSNPSSLTTSNTTSITSRESDFPPTTIVTATKVAPDHEDANEAVRKARREAEQLREQVRTLRQEQRDENQVVVVATAAPMETGTADEEEDDENQDRSKGKNGSTNRRGRKICSWIIALALLAGLVSSGVIALVATSQDEDPTPVPTFQPTTESPTLAPTMPCLTTIIAPANETLPLPPLSECQGDCDLDEDCEEGLQCFQRNLPFDLVPGCSCWEDDNSRNDYCVEIPNDPCLVETNDFPLGLCEGECESNLDCQAGLVCYQRTFEEEEIPGCQLCKTNQTFPDESALSLVTNGTRPEYLYGPATANDTRPPANDNVLRRVGYCVTAPEGYGNEIPEGLYDDVPGAADPIPKEDEKIAETSSGAAGSSTRYSLLLCILLVLIALFKW